MLVFGHVGITLAIMNGYEKVICSVGVKDYNFIDYRIVIIGAILPDLIDKPLIQLTYGLENHSGHSIGHTFIFSGLLMALGIGYFLNTRNNNILLLGLCCFLHQVFDKLMLLPNVLSLPTFSYNNNITFNRVDIFTRGTSYIFRQFPYIKAVTLYLMEPYVYISEIFGFLYILYFLYKLIINRI